MKSGRKRVKQTKAFTLALRAEIDALLFWPLRELICCWHALFWIISYYAIYLRYNPLTLLHYSALLHFTGKRLKECVYWVHGLSQRGVQIQSGSLLRQLNGVRFTSKPLLLFVLQNAVKHSGWSWIRHLGIVLALISDSKNWLSWFAFKFLSLFNFFTT